MPKYQRALDQLEELASLVDDPFDNHRSRETAARIERRIAELYGEAAQVYREVIPDQRIRPHMARKDGPTFPNFFEAGYLSGSTEYSIEGRHELGKAIGSVRTLALREMETARAPGPAKTTRPVGGNEVFLVHGHDEATLQAVAGFVRQLGLSVTILRDKANQGMTVIEKFVAHAGTAGFAIVLLTGDDVGGKHGTPLEGLQTRARQNVLFELGYFNGALGRGKVCALYQPGVEIPSDYAGVGFVELDTRGAWKLELARELRAAGLPVDLSAII